MTKIVIINENTYLKNVNEMGDIVGVFEDDHVFTTKEKDLFDIIDVPETKTVLDTKIPETKMLTKAATTEWTDEEPDRKAVWKDTDGEFKDIVFDPKYKLMYDTDKKEVTETYSRYLENLSVQTITSTKEVIE